MSRNSTNSTRIQDAMNATKIISSADLQQRGLKGMPDEGMYCISDENKEKRTNGQPKCGDEPVEDVGVYSQTLINNLKKISGTLPSSPPVKYSSSSIFHSPTVDYYTVTDSTTGKYVHLILNYWLEGEDVNCGMSNVVIYGGYQLRTIYPVPANQNYSWSGGGVTMCYVKIPSKWPD